MSYKYINTKYADLFDSSSSTTVIDNIIFSNYGYASSLVKEINAEITTTSIYVKFTAVSNVNSNLKTIMNIRTLNGANNLILKEHASQIQLTTYNNAFSWTGDVPSTAISISGYAANTFHKREIMIHFDTVQNHADLYSDGILYASISCANNGDYIRNITLGALDVQSLAIYAAGVSDIIVSDTEIPLTEKITEVTPTITSNDWSVVDGEATTDILGGEMTLTSPSGAIDETRRTLTGYSPVFFNCSSSETINALTITQGGNTQQVKIPTSGKKETKDVFSVLKLSDISASVVASYATP